MEESEKKEILHQVKREIYHIKKVTVHTAQQDGEISDPDIAIADTTVKRSQQAAYHLAARTGKLIFQRRQKDTAVRSLQLRKAANRFFQGTTAVCCKNFSDGSITADTHWYHFNQK